MSSTQRSEQTSTSQVGKINDQLLSILLRLSTCKTSPNYNEKTLRFSAYAEQLKMFIHEWRVRCSRVPGWRETAFLKMTQPWLPLATRSLLFQS